MVQMVTHFKFICFIFVTLMFLIERPDDVHTVVHETSSDKTRITTMSCGSRSRLILKLAAKYNEQNATIWQLQRSNNTEEDTRHKVICQEKCHKLKPLGLIFQLEENKTVQKLPLSMYYKQSERFCCYDFMEIRDIQLKFEIEKNEKKAEIENEWKIIKKIIERNAKRATAYPNKKVKKQWYDDDCYTATNRKREARRRWLRTEKLEDLDNKKKETRSTEDVVTEEERMDRRDDEGIENGGENNTKHCYQQIMNQNQLSVMKTSGIKNEEGDIEYEDSKKKNRWKQYFGKKISV
ncbi:hypothetical protein FQA39_LY11301 [Lamprigera yunnana]|nr:hypothetical protein FQA39_LY11301 [Lamprigera yunnana]